MQTMLYRPGTTEKIWGIDCDYIIVDDCAIEEHLRQGWYRRPDEMTPPEAPVVDAEKVEADIAASAIEIPKIVRTRGRPRKG